MRRDFHAGGKSNRGHAKPEQFSPEKQNHRADQHAQNWNRQIHCPVMCLFLSFRLKWRTLTISVFVKPVSTEISRDVSTWLDMTGRQNKSSSPFPKREDCLPRRSPAKAGGEGFLSFLAIPAR